MILYTNVLKLEDTIKEKKMTGSYKTMFKT